MAGLGLLLSYLLVVGAGVGIAFQQIVNSNLREELGSPWWAGFVSFAVGTLVMLVVALAMPGDRLSLSAISNSSRISWVGGLFGALFIWVSILLVPRLGAATVLALVVVGQMAGSIAFDHVGLLGLPQHPASLARLAGATLLICGVALIRM